MEHPAANRALIEQVLTEAQQACAESGQPARQLFGDAETYADEVAAERISEEARAAVDMDGIAPGQQLQGALLALGFAGTGLSIFVLLFRGWTIEVSGWQVALLGAANVSLAAAVAGELARRAGQVRRRWALVALAAVALAGGVVGAVLLEAEPPIGNLPALVPLLAYAALFVVVWNLPSPEPRPESARDGSAEEWFAQLGGLLRGRYYLTRPAAAGYVAEARAAWQESGAERPQDELGAPQVYALQVVDGSPQPHRARRRFLAWAATAIAVMWALFTGVYLWAGIEAGQLIWRLSATAFFVTGAVLAWRRHLRDPRTAPGSAGK